MDPRLARVLAGAAALAAAGLAATLGLAQQNVPAEAPIEKPADIGAMPPAPASPVAVPETSPVTEKAAPPTVDAAVDNDLAPPANAVAAPAKPVAPPPPALRPVRAPIAVLQALDKVTAETMRFQVPVPGRVRYKALVIEVKVCETRGADDPQPKPSAYLEVTSDPHTSARGGLLDRKQVFKGWMFANAPGVHALQHPTYDLWLIACGAAAAGK